LKKTIFTLLSIACMLYVFALAGGSDAGTVTVRQSLLGGSMGVAGTIVFAKLAERVIGHE
jgi:hypothetical protein